jgi:hypothetical protein
MRMNKTREWGTYSSSLCCRMTGRLGEAAEKRLQFSQEQQLPLWSIAVQALCCPTISIKSKKFIYTITWKKPLTTRAFFPLPTHQPTKTKTAVLTKINYQDKYSTLTPLRIKNKIDSKPLGGQRYVRRQRTYSSRHKIILRNKQQYAIRHYRPRVW